MDGTPLSDRSSPALTESTGRSRREFLRSGLVGGASLMLWLTLPGAARPGWGEEGAEPADPLSPNAFLRVESDGSVSVAIGKSEMGQGVRTSLAMIVADELDADWRMVRVWQPDADARFGDQDTGGSTSVKGSWMALRKTGAAARQMLLAAAATSWGVSPDSCRTEPGVVVHPATGRRAPYGSLVAAARTLAVPSDPPLKRPSEFRLIGKSTPRLDTPDKVTGKALYGIDVRVPGMLVATIVRCPYVGGSLKKYDDSAAKRIRGVRDVFPYEATPDGKASALVVLATSTWPAIAGSRALEVTWEQGDAKSPTRADIDRLFDKAASGGGVAIHDSGDVPKALEAAAHRVEAVYELPYLAHAPMEPLNCVADFRGDSCELWASTQIPTEARQVVAKTLGLPEEKVTVHVTLLGGGFGRRLFADALVEAALVSRRLRAPVQVVWTREDDIRHDYYRPASWQRVIAGLDAGGQIVAWDQVIVGPSISWSMHPNASGVPDKVPGDIRQGLDKPIYNLRTLRQLWVLSDPGLRVGWWRSVGNSQNAFVIESMIDELARAANKDPVAFRRPLLAAEPRKLAVLELAAERAGWGKDLGAGRGRGVAVHDTFGTPTAQVVEVSLSKDGSVRVDRVVCAIDCGTVVNPAIIASQMESGIAFALSAALEGRISLEDGRVAQSNFHDYRVLRMPDMPKVDVHIVPSSEPPGGVGEPGVPPLAPALANAIVAAGGPRVRQLPLRSS